MSIPTYVLLDNVPPPVTSGGIQSITDVYGEVWVAKPGVYSGAWRKARDVLHAVIYRAAAWTTAVAATTVAYDTVLRDTYGMFSSNGFLIPVNGWYRIQATGNTAVAAAGGYGNCSIYGGPSGATQLSFTNSTDAIASGGFALRTWIETYCSANDLILNKHIQNVANNGQTGQSNTRMEISFIGTG